MYVKCNNILFVDIRKWIFSQRVAERKKRKEKLSQKSALIIQNGH